MFPLLELTHRGNNAANFLNIHPSRMYEQLYPCDHCGGRPTVGRSQRVVAQLGDDGFDYGGFGRDMGPPEIGDTMPRPPGAPQTERIVNIHCDDCGMATPWHPVSNDMDRALDHVGLIWNRRLNRPPTQTADIQNLIEKELGTPDIQFVLDLLARTEGEWGTRGPLFAMLARRLVDATVVAADCWPIEPILKDAARYRKLAHHARSVNIDGERYIQFPEVYNANLDPYVMYEAEAAAAVDGLPDRKRW
ncbi:Lar family restriction alleviation protein [Paraburkholderia sediminicola]|uniref:Lar family restriction alleviation protein n=1 Tax=Paraburkholderia sediminicola TaxID=458836 RepID=UPI0038BDAFF4